jgi:hypothetical protein
VKRNTAFVVRHEQTSWNGNGTRDTSTVCAFIVGSLDISQGIARVEKAKEKDMGRSTNPKEKAEHNPKFRVQR